jgi:hypothetical protein
MSGHPDKNQKNYPTEVETLFLVLAGLEIRQKQVETKKQKEGVYRDADHLSRKTVSRQLDRMGQCRAISCALRSKMPM